MRQSDTIYSVLTRFGVGNDPSTYQFGVLFVQFCFMAHLGQYLVPALNGELARLVQFVALAAISCTNSLALSHLRNAVLAFQCCYFFSSCWSACWSHFFSALAQHHNSKTPYGECDDLLHRKRKYRMGVAFSIFRKLFKKHFAE